MNITVIKISLKLVFIYNRGNKNYIKLHQTKKPVKNQIRGMQ